MNEPSSSYSLPSPLSNASIELPPTLSPRSLGRPFEGAPPLFVLPSSTYSAWVFVALKETLTQFRRKHLEISDRKDLLPIAYLYGRVGYREYYNYQTSESFQNKSQLGAQCHESNNVAGTNQVG